MTVIISPAFPAESEKDDGKANHRENETRKRHDPHGFRGGIARVYRFPRRATDPAGAY